MPLRVYLLPHRIQEMLSCCPGWVSAYAALHLDSVGKILNHLLTITFVVNLFLFFSAWNVPYLPSLNMNTVLVSFLLGFQTAAVWAILNNDRISGMHFLAPTEFMVGVALGITVGGSVLAFVLSTTFRSVVSQCAQRHKTTVGGGGNSTTTTYQPTGRAGGAGALFVNDPVVYDYVCGQGSMTAIWWWGGLVFWLNFWSSLLLAIGRRELTTAISTQYEAIANNEDFEYAHPRSGAETTQPYANNSGTVVSDLPPRVGGPPRGFVGDYSTVPDIRHDDDDNAGSNRSSLQSVTLSETAESRKGYAANGDAWTTSV